MLCVKHYLNKHILIDGCKTEESLSPPLHYAVFRARLFVVVVFVERKGQLRSKQNVHCCYADLWFCYSTVPSQNKVVRRIQSKK